jgi:uncharacterized damage-inducible protein DinB
METSLKHMAWINQRIYQEVYQLPETVYGLTAAPGEWTVGRLVGHLLGASEWYRYCLDGIQYGDLASIPDHATNLRAQKLLAESDGTLIKHVADEDAIKEFNDENGPVQATVSTILAQAVFHAAAHQGEIATVLRQHGYELNLDPLDVWSYAHNLKK